MERKISFLLFGIICFSVSGCMGMLGIDDGTLALVKQQDVEQLDAYKEVQTARFKAIEDLPPLVDITLKSGDRIIVNQSADTSFVPYVRQPTADTEVLKTAILSSERIVDKMFGWIPIVGGFILQKEMNEDNQDANVKIMQSMMGTAERVSQTPISSNPTTITYGNNSGNSAGGDYQHGDINTETETRTVTRTVTTNNDNHAQKNVGNDNSIAESYNDQSEANENVGNEQWTDNHDESPAVFQPVVPNPFMIQPVFVP